MACWTLYKPARYATVPALVDGASILHANSFLMSIDEVVGILGSSAAALLTARRTGFSMSYSYLVSAGIMLITSAVLWFGLRGRWLS